MNQVSQNLGTNLVDDIVRTNAVEKLCVYVTLSRPKDFRALSPAGIRSSSCDKRELSFNAISFLFCSKAGEGATKREASSC